MEDPWDEDGDDELERTSWWPTARSEPSFEARKRGEERAGETLDQELAEERPERPPTEEAVGLEAEGIPDVEGQLVSDGSLEADGFASPEEAALSIRDEVPGATDRDDPHPMDDD